MRLLDDIKCEVLRKLKEKEKQTKEYILEIYQPLQPYHLSFYLERSIAPYNRYALKIWKDNMIIKYFDWENSLDIIFQKLESFLTEEPDTEESKTEEVETLQEVQDDGYIDISEDPEPKHENEKETAKQPVDTFQNKQTEADDGFEIIEEFDPSINYQYEEEYEYQTPKPKKRKSRGKKRRFKMYIIAFMTVFALALLFFLFTRLSSFYSSPKFLDDIQPQEHTVVDLDIYKNTLFVKPGDVLALPLMSYDANECKDVYIISRDIIQDGKAVPMPFLAVDPQASEGMVNAITITNGDHTEKLYIMITNETDLEF